MFKKRIFNIFFGWDHLFIIFCGLTFEIKLKENRLNKFISLGTRCFPRMFLTIHTCFKARKKYGELSCPFDLCITPLKSLEKILENDFADYFDDLIYDHESNWAFWRNKKYNIFYNHDNDIKTKDEFKKRYGIRIQNFKNIIKNNKKTYFMLSDFEKIDLGKLNNIYNSLVKYKLISGGGEN